MEDPWANAWGEPAKQSWPKPALDAEADIATPSWVAGPAVQWAEPSDTGDTHQATLSWHQDDEPSTGWPSSTYEDIPLGTLSTPQLDDSTVSSPVSPPLEPEPTSEHVQPEPEPEPEPTPPLPPASPDAFGTFETALETDEPDLDPWAAESVAIHNAQQEDVWVPTWGSSDRAAEARSANGSIDEWEEAKRQKARQDEHVPPEVLASILNEFRSLSNDIWPNSSLPEDVESASDRRNGMDGVEGLNSVANRLIPHDLTLPSFMHFPKTFTAKHMGDSLRLSRHVPITRLSPFTLYMTSKGSTAWETSVKSRIEIANDDLLPPGWRVVEKDKEEVAPVADTKKKSTGGLLSFFGRRPSTAPIESNPRRSESPSRAPSISTSITSSNAPSMPSPITSQTPRTSLDDRRSPARSSTPVLLGPSAPVELTSIASVPSLHPPTSDSFEQTPAPSAVSRFLTRFSRNKTIGPNAKESLALSTDDIEFLSDIVPSANDDADEVDQLRGLTSMISSSPLATTLPPPLAAPLPDNLSETLHSTPLTNPQDDLFSLFDSPLMNSTPVKPPHISSILPSQPASTPITPLPPSTSTFHRTESQGPSSSRLSGRSSSPFDISGSTSRSQTPLSQRRTPMAIMSTTSTSSGKPSSNVSLPPPPILPPPPLSKPTASHSRASSQHQVLEDNEDFTSFRSPPVSQPSLLSDTSTSSILSDQSLFSNTSSINTKLKDDLFDDFDDFVSSPIHDPSPPRPPAKPSLLGQKSMVVPVPVPLKPTSQPLVKHPSPPPQRVADHQRTMSLVNIAATRTGRWPAPPSPLPDFLPPPDAPRTTPITSGSLMQAQQSNGGGIAPGPSSSAFPFLPPPPGFSGVRAATPTMSPSPMLQFPTPSPISTPPVTKNLLAPVAKYTPSTIPTASGGLSAQDLSFFEGL